MFCVVDVEKLAIFKIVVLESFAMFRVPPVEEHDKLDVLKKGDIRPPSFEDIVMLENCA
jgi:hypothetical protein